MKQEGREGKEKRYMCSVPTGHGNQAQDLLRARQESVAAHYGCLTSQCLVALADPSSTHFTLPGRFAACGIVLWDFVLWGFMCVKIGQGDCAITTSNVIGDKSLKLWSIFWYLVLVPFEIKVLKAWKEGHFQQIKLTLFSAFGLREKKYFQNPLSTKLYPTLRMGVIS